MKLKIFLLKKVRKAIIEEILENAETEDEIKEQLWARIDEFAPKHIIIDDMFASVNYCLNLANGIGNVDDIGPPWKQTCSLCR